MRIRKEDFVAQGRAWWRAFRAGDERAQGHGMVALHKSGSTETR